MEIMKSIIIVAIGIAAYLFVFEKDKFHTASAEIKKFVDRFIEEQLDFSIKDTLNIKSKLDTENTNIDINTEKAE